MGNSDSSCIFTGNRSSYKLIGEIGRGGNGIVHDVEIIGDKNSIPNLRDGYVIKVLKKEGDWGKRKERFTREVNTVLKYQDQVKRMMPILDYSLDEVNDQYWFLMPKAKSYKYFRNDAYTNLKHMLELGKTISKLHSLHCAHRDIKPDNILFYDNRIYLSDYGLIWDESLSSSITTQGEHLGGFIIRPPEFEKNAYRKDDIEMNCASDVYLFAKTLWIVVSRKGHGFFGEYSRNDSSKCLNLNELRLGETIEPLHCLMEGATQDNYLERISIEQCLDLINTQLQIKERKISCDELDRLVYSERITEVTNTVLPDERIYTEIDSILKVIEVLKNAVDVAIDNSIHTVFLGKLTGFRRVKDNTAIIEVQSVVGKKLYYVSFEYVKISGEGLCTCRLKPSTDINDLGARRLSEISEIELITEKKVIIDTIITINLICPTA